MRDEEVMEQMEKQESYMILYRFHNCVRNMLKSKQKKETFITENRIENFDTPSITCEYTAEQWEMVQELKKELECLSAELGLVFQGYQY